MKMFMNRGSVRLSSKNGRFCIGSTFKWDDTEGVGGVNHRVLFGFTKSKNINSTTYQISLLKLRLFSIKVR